MISQDPGPQGPGKIKKRKRKLQATSSKLQAKKVLDSHKIPDIK
jgi:hypothetical protein